MKIYNSDLYYVLNNINVLKEIKGAKLVISINRALTKVKEEVRLLELIIEDTDEYKEYIKELNKLKVDCSKKDKLNNPILITNTVNGVKQSTYDINNVKEFNKGIELLNTKYKKEIDNKRLSKEEYIKIISSETEFKRIKFKESDIPEDVTFEQIEIMSLLLDF